jgi:hypothetical protein
MKILLTVKWVGFPVGFIGRGGGDGFSEWKDFCKFSNYIYNKRRDL